MRREVAIALRNLESENNVVSLWTELAVQHDGSDRWYLEALGIGAHNHWDACFNKWMSKAVENWKQKPGRDIVWRSRAQNSLEYQLELLKDPELAMDEVARMLRATDFQSDLNKTEKLAALLHVKREDQDDFNRLVLNQLDPEFASKSSTVRNAANEILPDLFGTSDYLDLVKNLDLENENENIFKMVLDKPNHELGVRAAHLVFWLERC